MQRKSDKFKVTFTLISLPKIIQSTKILFYAHIAEDKHEHFKRNFKIHNFTMVHIPIRVKNDPFVLLRANQLTKQIENDYSRN